MQEHYLRQSLFLMRHENISKQVLFDLAAIEWMTMSKEKSCFEMNLEMKNKFGGYKV